MQGSMSLDYFVLVFFSCDFVHFQLALKHRQNRNQKMRIVAFIGSPITTEEKDVRVGQMVTLCFQTC